MSTVVLRRRTRAPGVWLAALAVLVATGCADIPSSGPVTRVADDRGLGESTVRYSPARPADGASPQEIVRGYLDAMLGYPVSSGTASAFLTHEAAERWRPTAGVRVYSTSVVTGPSPVAGRAEDPGDKTRNPVEVRVDLDEDAQLDRQGHHVPRSGSSEVTYHLERVDGQWRIADPQPGVLVSRKFFDDYYRPFEIYFFDRPGERLVPDRIHLVVGAQLATSLVTSLARGPGPSTEGTARTYVPELRHLRPSVPVDDGVADVEFDVDFAELGESVRDHLSAQIVWTLRQVPDVSAVRLLGGGTVLSEDGRTEQDITSWGGYGPSLGRGTAHAVVRDKVVEIDGGDVRPLSGAWGKDARGASAVAVSDDGIAGVLEDRTLLRVTDREGRKPRTFEGRRLLTPRWDGDGTWWVVDRADGQTRVRLAKGDSIRAVDPGRLARLDVTSFQLSPDGGRYAVTVRDGGGTVRVGRVMRDVKNRVLGLGDPVRVETPARAPGSVSWVSGTEVTYLADSTAGRQVYTSAIDGSSTSGGISGGGPLLPDVGARTLVVGPGEEPVRHVIDARGRLWMSTSGSSWRALRSGGVTGLNATG